MSTPEMQARLAEQIIAATARTGGSPFWNGGQTETRSYVWDPAYIDGLVAYQQTNEVGTSMYYAHSGAQYSVQAVTSETGQVVERYSYDAYGTRTVEGASNGGRSVIGLTTGFTGRALDEETGLYYFRNRMYSGRDGRFVNRDPMGYVDGMSLYRGYFVPVGVDPSGNRSLGLKFLIRYIETVRTGPGRKAMYHVDDEEGEMPPLTELLLKGWLAKQADWIFENPQWASGTFRNAIASTRETGWVISDSKGILGPSFWLSTAHEVWVDAEYKWRLDPTCDEVQFENMVFNLRWWDDIDANSFREAKDKQATWSTLVEGSVDFFLENPIIDLSFPTVVRWRDAFAGHRRYVQGPNGRAVFKPGRQ